MAFRVDVQQLAWLPLGLFGLLVVGFTGASAFFIGCGNPGAGCNEIKGDSIKHLVELDTTDVLSELYAIPDTIKDTTRARIAIPVPTSNHRTTMAARKCSEVRRVAALCRRRPAGSDALARGFFARAKGDNVQPPPALAMPYVVAAEWRLAAGDARAADSLALLGRVAAAVDSLALQRSAYAGRAELVRARKRRAG